MIPRGGSVVFEVHVGESRAARDRTREGSRVLPENRRRLGRAERGDGESTVRSKRLHRAGRDAIEPRDGEEHDRRGRVGLSVVEKVVHLADEVGVPPPEDEGGAGVGVRVGRRLGGDDRLSDPRERLPMEEVPVHVVLIPDETQLLRRASAVGRRARTRARACVAFRVASDASPERFRRTRSASASRVFASAAAAPASKFRRAASTSSPSMRLTSAR